MDISITNICTRSCFINLQKSVDSGEDNYLTRYSEPTFFTTDLAIDSIESFPSIYVVYSDRKTFKNKYNRARSRVFLKSLSQSFIECNREGKFYEFFLSSVSNVLKVSFLEAPKECRLVSLIITVPSAFGQLNFLSNLGTLMSEQGLGWLSKCQILLIATKDMKLWRATISSCFSTVAVEKKIFQFELASKQEIKEQTSIKRLKSGRQDNGDFVHDHWELKYAIKMLGRPTSEVNINSKLNYLITLKHLSVKFQKMRHSLYVRIHLQEDFIFPSLSS